MISQEYPGSVADIELLRRHAFEVNAMLGDSQMLADLGYRGETNVPNCQVVCQTSEIEKRTRLIVERFFGRLKKLLHCVLEDLGTLSKMLLDVF